MQLVRRLQQLDAIAVMDDPAAAHGIRAVADVDQLILQVPRSTFGDDTLASLSAPLPLPGKDDSLTHIVSGLMQMAIGEAHKLDEAGSLDGGV